MKVTLSIIVQEMDVDNRMTLYHHIVLSGGSTMYPGMPSRLEHDIRALYLQHVLKVGRPCCFVPPVAPAQVPTVQGHGNHSEILPPKVPRVVQALTLTDANSKDGDAAIAGEQRGSAQAQTQD